MGRFTDYRTFKTAVGGRLLQLEIGKVCEQANGQVMVRYGESVVNVSQRIHLSLTRNMKQPVLQEWGRDAS